MNVPVDADHPGTLAATSRVLQHDGVRLSIKLEDEYWDALRELADGEATSLAKYVHKVLAPLPDGVNRTAALRHHCFAKMKQALGPARLSGGDARIIEFITACPVPVVVLTAERRIIAYNSSFAEEFLAGIDPADSDSPDGKPRLTFSQPFNRIIEYLLGHSREVVAGQMGFISGTTTKQRRVRYALVDRGQGMASPVLVFVEPQREVRRTG